MPRLHIVSARSRRFLFHLGHGLLVVLVGMTGCGDATPDAAPADLATNPAPSPNPTSLSPNPAPNPAPTNPPTPEPPSSTVAPPQSSPAEKAARDLLADLIANRFAAAAETFSPAVLEALPADKLKANWETVQAQAGAYQSVAKTATEMKIQTNQVVDLLCTFEKTDLVFRVSYNSETQVAGIFFLPPPKPAPAPAKSSRKEQPPDIELKTPNATLYGTIDWPSGEGPFPAVLVISGSGPNDRDGNQATLKSDYMKKLGKSLAAHGIAVLRFDKRGSGRSQFTKGKEIEFRFGSMITDARGWLTLMRQHERISRIGIIGHSQGSLVALLTTQETPVAAVVSIAGAGQSIDKVMETQLTKNLASMPELRDQSLAIIKQLAAGKTVDTIPPTLATLFRPSVQPFLISWMKHDPRMIIAKTTTPTLIVQGTRDIQVTVSDARALKDAQSSAALVLIEDMNHVLRHITTDAEQLPSYSNPELPLAPELVPALLAFLKEELVAQPAK